MASGIGEIARVSVRGNLKQLVTTFRAQSESVRDTLQTNSRTTNKYSTSSLSYPLNVEGDPQQGHYISFYARVQDKAKLKAFKAQDRLNKSNKRIAAETGRGNLADFNEIGVAIDEHAISGFTYAEVDTFSGETTFNK